MSILIRGSKMPKNCIECLSTLGLFSKTCPISDDSNIDVEFAKNHIYDGCPLVEIPPHGDLIDRDKLFYNTVREIPRGVYPVVDYVIDTAPTVIESEEE